MLNSPDDLRKAFGLLGEKIWIRATEGGGGRGALPTDDYEFARIWVDRFNGWGTFTASKLLSKDTVTWLSIWYRGELVVAQTRKRLSWNFANRTLSGVTGVTRVGQTCSDPAVDSLSLDAIKAVDDQPHGIYGVDITYGHDALPYVTEINISRFFTTHYFFTKAGLNMPEIFCNIALDGNFPSLDKKINPLPDDLLWIRGMDVEPVLTTLDKLKKYGETVTWKSLENKTILVTGANGFIGSHLARRLSGVEGVELLLLSRHRQHSSQNNVTWLQGALADLTSEYWAKNQINSIDVVFHLGAFIPKSGSEGNRIDRVYTDNLEGTRTLLEGLPQRIKCIVFSSSIDVYAPPVSEAPLTEQSKVDPANLYGASKLFCERLVAEWAKSMECKYALLRYGHIYGPGEEAYSKLIPVVIRQLLAGKSPSIYGNGSAARDFPLCR